MISANPSESTQNPSTTSDLPKVYSIPIAPEALAHYSRELNLEPNAALSTLAKAIASSPNWEKIPETVLIVRSTPQPALGVLGCFDRAKEVEIQIQLKSLSGDLARLRYVSYQQAELDCQHLATQLVERFGSKELQRFQFTGIPRGGLIVMGMLAYALKLKPEQLVEPSTKKDVPLVVVDDCVFTGSRLSHFLQCNPDQKVVFAHLYSHQELRANILATEPNVIDCLSACDIKDYAPEDLGNNYSTWRSHSLANLNGTRYWVGKTDHVGFAWNEPDRFFWNPLTQKMEASWLLVPKEFCLKNRFKAATQTAVQIQAETSSAIKLASSVIFGQYRKQVIIGNLHTQQSFGLNDLAADIWLAVVKYGNLEQVITALLQNYDVDEATLRVDVSAFINQLFQQGLLQN